MSYPVVGGPLPKSPVIV